MEREREIDLRSGHIYGEKGRFETESLRTSNFSIRKFDKRTVGSVTLEEELILVTDGSIRPESGDKYVSSKLGTAHTTA